jgi:hypothetical protein
MENVGHSRQNKQDKNMKTVHSVLFNLFIRDKLMQSANDETYNAFYTEKSYHSSWWNCLYLKARYV